MRPIEVPSKIVPIPFEYAVPDDLSCEWFESTNHTIGDSWANLIESLARSLTSGSFCHPKAILRLTGPRSPFFSTRVEDVVAETQRHYRASRPVTILGQRYWIRTNLNAANSASLVLMMLFAAGYVGPARLHIGSKRCLCTSDCLAVLFKEDMIRDSRSGAALYYGWR